MSLNEGTDKRGFVQNTPLRRSVIMALVLNKFDRKKGKRLLKNPCRWSSLKNLWKIPVSGKTLNLITWPDKFHIFYSFNQLHYLRAICCAKQVGQAYRFTASRVNLSAGKLLISNWRSSVRIPVAAKLRSRLINFFRWNLTLTFVSESYNWWERACLRPSRAYTVSQKT